MYHLPCSQFAWQFNEQKPALLSVARSPSPNTSPKSSAKVAPNTSAKVVPNADPDSATSLPSAASLLIPKRLIRLPDWTELPKGLPLCEPWRGAVVGQDLCLVLCRQASVKFQTKSVVMHGAADLGPMHVSHDAAHSLKLGTHHLQSPCLTSLRMLAGWAD